MVFNLLRPFRSFAPSYFDDIFVHSRAEGGMTDVAVHLQHLRQVFQVMRDNQLYANLKKCIFCAPEIPVLGSYVSKNGVRADPEKIEAICAWPTPQDQNNSGNGWISRRISTTTRRTSRRLCVRCRSYSRHTPRGRGARNTRLRSTR
ncbi:hypothetical protein PC116_g4895 [Phytophthora cactorum]|uniref:Reverse transcriptase domain-containing protein n=2 Tax=Phytophthora cactorum TaxID=29920 RepID=A0A8T1DNI4_9STRA|nr:hypothetical protein PC111_g1580 [Phytophthora cactorum]KAG2930324.1 hypothetical protein PC114_g2520 [Phytophthora cactorum]KAG2942548.1 hypothetical protein PC115_g1407 [Phytophthora cactorum]KAG2997567.1 hypothetical protein PC118_g1859 [Phytophthora cactorum]KAG3040133.1 hypothetical protein PC119_g1611 [Phytophthora cactorum]